MSLRKVLSDFKDNFTLENDVICPCVKADFATFTLSREYDGMYGFVLAIPKTTDTVKEMCMQLKITIISNGCVLFECSGEMLYNYNIVTQNELLVADNKVLLLSLPIFNTFYDMLFTLNCTYSDIETRVTIVEPSIKKLKELPYCDNVNSMVESYRSIEKINGEVLTLRYAGVLFDRYVRQSLFDRTKIANAFYSVFSEETFICNPRKCMFDERIICERNLKFMMFALENKETEEYEDVLDKCLLYNGNIQIYTGDRINTKIFNKIHMDGIHLTKEPIYIISFVKDLENNAINDEMSLNVQKMHYLKLIVHLNERNAKKYYLKTWQVTSNELLYRNGICIRKYVT
jgi:hypothetical protein